MKGKIWGIVLILVLGFIATLAITFEKINLQGYGEPIVFHPIDIENDSLLGVWYADFGYFHDCSGCETKNEMWLFMGKDSTVAINEDIQNLSYTFYASMLDQYFAIPKRSLDISLTEYELRGDCLIEFGNEETDSLLVASFFSSYPGCSQYISKVEKPVSARTVTWDNDKIILTD